MADEKPGQTVVATPKVVSESDFIAFKKGSLERERRMKEELAKVKGQLSQTEAELKITKTDVGDDEEVSKVKAYLIEEAKKLRKERAELETDLTSFKERDKEVRVKMLASKYGVDEESISGEEDPEKKALELFAERLIKEKEESATLAAKKAETPESIYETGTPGGVKTQPKDMSDGEFDKHWGKIKREALSK